MSLSVWIEKGIENQDGNVNVCNIATSGVQFNMETKVAAIEFSTYKDIDAFRANKAPAGVFTILLTAEQLGSVTIPTETSLYEVIFTQILTVILSNSWSPLYGGTVHNLEA